MKGKNGVNGDKTGLFFCLPIATSAFSNNAGPSHSIQIPHKRPRISRTALTLVKVFPAGPENPFSIRFSSHTYSNNSQAESQIHRFRTFLFKFSGPQPQTLYSSSSKRKQQQVKNNATINSLFFGGKDWGGQPQIGTGQF